MSIKASFINDGQAYDANDFAEYFSDFVSSGVYADPADGLLVSLSGNEAVVKEGKAFIRGVRVENDTEMRLGIVQPSAGASRLDMVVARVDWSRPSAGLYVKQGVEGSGEYPALSRSEDVWEICLAKYSVTGGSRPSNIVDTRLDEELCGLVSNILHEPNVQEMRQRFEEFMAGVQETAETELEKVEEQSSQAIASVVSQVSAAYGSKGRQGFCNPAFRVNQRGLSEYRVGTGTAYTFDRWAVQTTGSMASDVVVSRAYEPGKEALKLSVPAWQEAASGVLSLFQAIEGGVKTFCGGDFVVSFDAKATVPQRMAVRAVQHASETSEGVELFSGSFAVTEEWTRYEARFSGTLTPGAEDADVLKVAFDLAWKGAGSQYGEDQDAENAVQIANVQINVGTEALLAYVPQIWEDELACRRYYRKRGTSELAVGQRTTTGKKARAQEIDLSDMRGVPKVTFKDRNGEEGKVSAYTIAGTVDDGLSATVSSFRSKSAVLVVETGAVSPASIIVGELSADSEYYL